MNHIPEIFANQEPQGSFQTCWRHGGCSVGATIQRQEITVAGDPYFSTEGQTSMYKWIPR